MSLSIEKRLALMGDVSNLMLVGSIHAYSARKRSRVRVHLSAAKDRREKAAA